MEKGVLRARGWSNSEVSKLECQEDAFNAV